MPHPFKATAIAVAAVLAAGGCTQTPAATDSAAVPGVAGTFETTYDHLTPAALKAIVRLDIDVIGSRETEQGTTYTLSKATRGLFPGGTGQVFIRRTATPPTILTGSWDGPSEVQVTGQGTAAFVNALFPAIVAVRPSDTTLYSDAGTARILTITPSSAAVKSYGVLKTDGSIDTVTSYSALAVNDCARLTQLRGRTDYVLERIDHANCGGIAGN